MKTGEDAVAELLDTLNQLSIDYMVVGSFSSNRYGVPRATKDADLVLKIETAERETLFSKLPESFEIDPQVTFEMVNGTWHLAPDHRDPNDPLYDRIVRTEQGSP
jgi:hypothetical protein